MRTAVRTAFAGVVFGLAATGAAAQGTTAGRFTVTPVIGTVRWDDASALANKEADENGAFTKSVITPTVGLAAEYLVWRQLGAGFFFEAARPTTRGDYFPSALFRYGTRADLRTVSQRVTVLMYGVQGSFGFNVGRFEPFASAGIGAVTVNGDPQQSDQNASFTNGMFQVGGGIGWRISPSASLRLDLRDLVFTDWDREQLNPVSPAFQNVLFPAANGRPPEEKSTVHNFRIAFGFSYVPRRGSMETGGNESSERE